MYSMAGCFDLEPEGSNRWAVKTIINIDGPKKKSDELPCAIRVDSVGATGVQRRCMGPASDSSRPRNETSKPLISAYEPRFGRISATL